MNLNRKSMGYIFVVVIVFAAIAIVFPQMTIRAEKDARDATETVIITSVCPNADATFLFVEITVNETHNGFVIFTDALLYNESKNLAVCEPVYAIVPQDHSTTLGVNYAGTLKGNLTLILVTENGNFFTSPVFKIS